MVAKYEPEAKSFQALLVALSWLYRVAGVPTLLLVYSGGELVTSRVQLATILGENLYSSGLEQFLVEH